MPVLHIANTDLELEIVHPGLLSLEQGLTQNSVIHQLQFLPILYAEQNDGLCVTNPPFPLFETPKWHLFSDLNLPYDHVESWAPSKRIAMWAQERGLSYQMPDWEVVKEVNSKAFSFEQGPLLPGAELIDSWDRLQKWIQQTPGPKVLKSCFGVSGKGHLHLPAPLDKIEAFAMKEFNASRPLIAEPWVERKLDFSTQWVISKNQNIEYLGSTLLQSNPRGQYHGNQAGDENVLFGACLPKLHEHQIYAQKALHKMASLGFFGNVGIDAMIWGENLLHPIVEINARKTMGWISLQIAKRLFANQTITVSYVTARRFPDLLPQGFVKPNGEIKLFSRYLHVDVLAE